MKRSLKAFISYRHDDAFAPTKVFVEKIKSALIKAGFNEIFEDFGSIGVGQDFENLIYRGISGCDLFVPLIGMNWLDILKEKAINHDNDVLVREVRDAIHLDKEILPVLVDGATMPSARDLPKSIRPLHRKNGVPIQSDNSDDEIAPKFDDTVARINHIRKLGAKWLWGYCIVAAIIWFLGSVLTNAVGWWEFGSEPWLGMALAWSGFFVFPVFVLPFTLLALYRPLTVLTEATINAVGLRDRLTYFSPVLIGAVLAAIGVYAEALPPEVPWTIYPSLTNCEGGERAASSGLDALCHYDQAGILEKQQQYKDAFWLKNKRWPNVFFYLTIPRLVELLAEHPERGEFSCAGRVHLAGSGRGGPVRAVQFSDL